MNSEEFISKLSELGIPIFGVETASTMHLKIYSKGTACAPDRVLSNPLVQLCLVHFISL